MSDEVIEAEVIDEEFPPEIKKELREAYKNIARCDEGTTELAYWSGMFDGLTTAFSLMMARQADQQKKNG